MFDTIDFIPLHSLNPFYPKSLITSLSSLTGRHARMFFARMICYCLDDQVSIVFDYVCTAFVRICHHC